MKKSMEKGKEPEGEGEDEENLSLIELVARRKKAASRPLAQEKKKTRIVYPSERTHEETVLQYCGKQEPAFEAAGDDLVVISGELNNTKRFYMVTGWKGLDRFYVNCEPERRVLHEMMRDHQPCRLLYVDLDCNKKMNPGITDYTPLVNELVEVVLRGLHELLGVNVEEDVDMLYLDSSNQDKFSAHVLFEIEGAYWRNREECHRFMKALMKDVPKESILYVDDEIAHTNPREGGKPGGTRIVRRLCPDMSIYSRNHTFRMFGSTKKGSWRPMIHEERDADKSRRVDMKTFERSLVTRFPRDYDFRNKRMIEMEDVEASFVLPSPRLERFEDAKRSVGKNSGQGDWFSGELSALQDAKATPDCARLLDALLPRAQREEVYYPSNWRFDRTRMTLTAGTFEKYCSYKGSDHTHNNSCYVIDLRDLFYYRRCYSPNCGNNKQELTLFSEGVAASIAKRIVKREMGLIKTQRDTFVEAKRKEIEESSEPDREPPKPPLLPFEPDPSVVLDLSRVFSFWTRPPQSTARPC